MRKFLCLQHYDRRNDSSRRTLLSHNASSSSNGKVKQQTPMMVQPCDDIYLCDNCDAEFVGLANMKVLVSDVLIYSFAKLKFICTNDT